MEGKHRGILLNTSTVSNATRIKNMTCELVLEVMSVQHGHKDMRYNPNNKEEVKKIRDFILKKIKDGWKLYGMKAGEKTMTDMTKFPNKIEDKDLDRFILAGKEQVVKKMLAMPNAGG